MAKSKTERDRHVSCLKVEMAGKTDLYALIVVTNEDRDTYHSAIHLYPDFPSAEATAVVSMFEWIVDFTVLADGTILAITADGKSLVYRGGGELQPRSDRPLFSITADERRHNALAVGWGGRAHLWTGSAWQDMASPGQEDLLCGGIRRDGVLFAGGKGGALYRSDGTTWSRIELDTNVAIEAIAFGPDLSVLAGGSAGALFLSQDGLAFEAVQFADGDVKGACFHKGRFVVAGPGFSFVALDGTDIVPFKTGRKPYKITAHADWILAAEDDAILYFTGEGWFRMPVV